MEQKYISQNNYDNDEISLKDFILKIKEGYNFLQTKWQIILIVSSIGASIGLTLTFIIKPTYKATLTFAMEEDKGGSAGLSGALGLASSFGIDLGGAGGGGAFAASNLAELMKSRLIVEKVELEKEYFKKKSFLLDLYIIIKTFTNVLFSKGVTH